MKLNYPRDTELFLLLWKYKVATTHSIWAALFKDSSMKTCYERLMKLKKSNFVKRISIDESHFAWTLSTNGYIAIRDQLNELKVPGYGSEFPIHDLLVNLASFEDYWPELPDGISFLSEEEIKRLHSEYLPEWYPFDLMRRPDGFWRTNKGDHHSIIALEVETSLKSVSKYESIARQYELASEIFRIIWFVPTKSMAQTIFNSFENKIGSENFRHNFILISDLVSHGWMASVYLGADQNSEVVKVLQVPIGSPSVPGRRLSHLDLSITPHKSKASGQFSKPVNSDSTACLSASVFSNTPFAQLIKI